MLDAGRTFVLRDEERTLRPGNFAHVPPATIHGDRNGSAAPARFLAWTPGGSIGQFLVDVSEHVRSMPEDAGIMSELVARDGIVMGGGPPRSGSARGAAWYRGGSPRSFRARCPVAR